jgi:hypothetical protein
VQTLQRTAATVFSLSLAALIVFWTVKDTKPSGGAVFPVLYGALGTAAVIWLTVTLVERRNVKWASQATGTSPWKRELVSHLQESMSPILSEPPQDRARREARELADVLADLYAVAPQEQTNAQQWDGNVRAELALHARRFLPEWEAVAVVDAKLTLLRRIINELRDGK